MLPCYIVHGNELDHNVHIYGWSDPRVIKNIKESDDDIKKVTSIMQPNSLIMVFGDHGATRDGHHGGDTKEELESGMFAYTKKKFTFKAFQFPQKLPIRAQELISLIGDKMNHTFLNRDAFPQIDGVPTMSSIFNTPIPYSNLGVIAPELMHYDNCSVASCLYELFMDHVLNYAQVLTYVDDFANKRNTLHDQLKAMQEPFVPLKANILDIMQRAPMVLKTEEDYVNSQTYTMSEQSTKEYLKFVDDMFEVMIFVREKIQANSGIFKSQWSNMNQLLLYTNLVIRFFVTLLIIGVIVLLYVSLERGVADIFTTQFATVYAAIGSVVFFAFVLMNQQYMDLSLVMVYAGIALAVAIVCKLCWKYKSEIVTLVKSDVYKMPTVIAGLLMFLEFIAHTNHVLMQHTIVLYFSYTAIACYVVIVACKRPEKWTIFAAAVGLALLCRAIISFPSFKVDTNYLICSLIPSIIFFIGVIYLMCKKTPSGLNTIARAALLGIFVASFVGMMHYQIGELDGSFKSNYFTYIILPRSIFILTVAQFAYLLLSLYFRCLLWKNEPYKAQRIYAFFLFLSTSILPSLLMMVGPYQQIYFLALYLIAQGLNYTLEKIGQANTLFHYVLYTSIMRVIYSITGHTLDFMALKIQRAFVGFPEFSTGINFGLAFFETVGVFSFMLVIVPTICMTPKLNDVANDYKECMQSDMEAVEMVSPSHPSNESKLEITKPREIQHIEEWKIETIMLKNYLAILLDFEMVHNGFTRYLVSNFNGMFFMVSPIEFTFRFIDWYIYIQIFIYAYILGKI